MNDRGDDQPVRVRPGLSLAERQLARQQITDAYVADARRKASRAHRTMRCVRAAEAGWPAEEHAGCKGELRRTGGCLCECHDAAAGAEVLSRKDEPPAGRVRP